MAFKFFLFILSLSILSPVLAQPTCTPSMITSFIPCLNFTSSGGANTSAPSQDCCTSINTLTTGGKDCLCLIASGMVPFQIPINRTLAISLPRACNMPGVPMNCKAAGAGAPSPGPAMNGPSASPAAAPSPSSIGQSPPESQSPGSAPGADATPVPTPPSPTANGGPPGSSTGSRAGVTPSAAAQLLSSVSFTQIVAVVALVSFKNYF